MSKEFLIKYIPVNKSGGEVILSIGEGLLLVLDVYRKAKVEKIQIEKLYKLYLEGSRTEESMLFLKELKEVLTDKKYTVNSDPKTINDDPTRRYFETQLAYYLLQNNAEDLEHQELGEFTQNLKTRLFALPNAKEHQPKVNDILSGNMRSKLLNKYEKEYAELISKLIRHNFYGLSAKACENLLQIARGTILATLNTQLDSSMPVDIYEDSIFTMGMDGRGRIMKKPQDLVKTTAKGLMKSSLPLPMYGDVANAVYESYQKISYSPFQRSADQATFMIDNQWVQYLFSHQIQLYSNGISSTTLAQLRNMILEKRLDHAYYKGFFQHYMTVFASLMLYNSGGHSLFEIFEVFKLPFCRELMETEPHIVNGLEQDNLMYQWLYQDQPDAFEKALKFTLNYFHVLLAKKILNAQFKKEYSIVLTEPEQPMTLHRALAINMPVDEFEQLILDAGKEGVDSPNPHDWTPLMIAAQMGKIVYVKCLLAAGAQLNKQVQTLCALDVAIKCGHYDIVRILLKAGATVKHHDSTLEGLRNRASALYFACRQPDLRILRSILEHGHGFDMKDIHEAILAALKVENFDALRTVVQYIYEQKKASFFTEHYKSELVLKAVGLGSKHLVQEIMALDFCLSADQLDYKLLINTAAEKKFLRMADWLLEAETQCGLAINQEPRIEPARAEKSSINQRNHSFFGEETQKQHKRASVDMFRHSVT